MAIHHLLLDATESLVDTVIRFAMQRDPTDAAEAFLTTLDSEIEHRGDRGLNQADVSDLLALAEDLRIRAAIAPAVARALTVAIELGLTNAPSSGETSPTFLARTIRAGIRLCLSQLRDRRDVLALEAAGEICSGETLFFHGVGRRHQALACHVASRVGKRVRVLISGPEPGGTDEGSLPAWLAAADLRAQLTGWDGPDGVPEIAPIRLADAPATLQESDHTFMLTTAVTPAGDLVTQPGGEIVYQAAARCSGVTILVDEYDLYLHDRPPAWSDAWSVVQVGAGTLFLTPMGWLKSANLRSLCSSREPCDDSDAA